ncbi:MAG: hypothetical protein HC907_35750 [Richelia sp. SM1_7_0]|nr:hypothetical protein [Richelia sp. SM1_7_0]
MQRVQLRPGIELIVNNLKFHNDFILEAEYKDASSAFGISFCLAGSSRGKVNGIEEEFNLTSGQGSVGFALERKGIMEYKAGQRVTVVTLVMAPMMFNNFIDSQVTKIPQQLQKIIDGKCNSFYTQNFEMTSVMKMAAQQILNCPYQGLTKQLYLESKGIEIIAYYTDLLSQNIEPSPQLIPLKADDITRIYHAKEILSQQMKNPPSLVDLAKIVGLNDYKLKLGFSSLFWEYSFWLSL